MARRHPSRPPRNPSTHTFASSLALAQSSWKIVAQNLTALSGNVKFMNILRGMRNEGVTFKIRQLCSFSSRGTATHSAGKVTHTHQSSCARGCVAHSSGQVAYRITPLGSPHGALVRLAWPESFLLQPAWTSANERAQFRGGCWWTVPFGQADPARMHAPASRSHQQPEQVLH